MTRRNALTNAATDLYPTAAATALSLLSLERNRMAAALIRSRVR